MTADLRSYAGLTGPRRAANSAGVFPMAEATKTAPSTPSTPVQEVPAKPKKARVTYQELFDTAEAAIAAAAERTKGPRRAFAVKDPSGKTWYVVHNNDGRALGVVAAQLGCTA